MPNDPKNERQIPRDVAWTQNLQPDFDPNRSPHIQITDGPPNVVAHRPRDLPTGQSTRTTAPSKIAPQQEQSEPSYYDVPMLKAPVWKWEIASYFFFGGLSAGAHLIGRMAEIFGGERFRSVRKAGSLIAVVAALPCAPLLIHDLGDPKRFHHMLRVWKPTSPMNLGTWIVTGFNAAAAIALVREWAEGRTGRDRTMLDEVARWIHKNRMPLMVVSDAAGVPLGILMAGYTGVLLSCTSTPVWTQNPWLGPLFSASSLATGAAAITLALESQGIDPDDPARRALDKIDTAAHVAEAVALGGFLKKAGPLAKPLTTGKMKHHLWASLGGLAAAEVLKHLPLPRGSRGQRLASAAGAVVGLAAGFSLRWGIVHAGRESANDPHAARLASRPESTRTREPSSATRQRAMR